MTQASPDPVAMHANQLGDLAQEKQLSKLSRGGRNEPPRPGGGQESPSQLRLEFHSFITEASSSSWVPPPASALLPCAGVHYSLLPAYEPVLWTPALTKTTSTRDDIFLGAFL